MNVNYSGTDQNLIDLEKKAPSEQQLSFEYDQDLQRRNDEILKLKISDIRSAFFRIFEFYHADCYHTPQVRVAKDQISLAFEQFEISKRDIKKMNSLAN